MDLFVSYTFVQLIFCISEKENFQNKIKTAGELFPHQPNSEFEDVACKFTWVRENWRTIKENLRTVGWKEAKLLI